jgi:acyl carrier protein|tara:strand:+ start:129 stop:362 length:234 start_codon:yes stop_codon:yes gene_type:complete
MIISPFKLVSEALECDEKSLNESSGLNNHAGWDSMGHLTIMMTLEKSYGIEINDKTINQFQSMAKIIALYNSLQKES